MGKSPKGKVKKILKPRGEQLKVSLFKGPLKSLNVDSSVVANRNQQIVSHEVTSSVVSLPLHSSTPKPNPKFNKSVPHSSQKSGLSHLEATLGTKELVIVLERINLEDYFKRNNEKTLSQNNFKPSSKSSTKVKKVVKPVKSKPTVNRKIVERQIPPRGPPESTVATQIPSEVLENFGIFSDQSPFVAASPPRNALDRVAHIETPPQTSTACSSHNSDENLLDVTCDSSTEQVLLRDSLLSQPPAKCHDGEQTPSESNKMLIDCHQELVTLSCASSSNLMDPLETKQLSLTDKSQLSTISIHWEVLYGLVERLYTGPPLYSIEEIGWFSSEIRRVAPYALKPNLSKNEYLLYAAPVSRSSDNYCCIIFGVLNGYMIAYGGHFIVRRQHLYDPIKKIPAIEVKLTHPMHCRQHLGLLNIPNKVLLNTEFYFPQASDPSYADIQMGSLDIFMSSINQLQLKERTRSEILREQYESQFKSEGFVQFTPSRSLSGVNRITFDLRDPRTEQVFGETCLPIDESTVGRILAHTTRSDDVKTKYGDFGTLFVNCAFDSKFETIYYVAYSGSGCTSFYRNAFILGYHDDNFIVGVVVNESFFILATKRLYSRYSSSQNVQPVRFHPDMLDVIHLPFWLSRDTSLVMLATRQILRQPLRYKEMHLKLLASLGISELETPCLLSSSVFKSKGNYVTWLQKMVNSHFNTSFRNALCHFPLHPSHTSNPLLFTENLTKIWVHHIIRLINDIPNGVPSYPSYPKLAEFFSYDASAFVSVFLSLFGLSNDSKFQCQRLDSHGLPTSVCLESLPARQIGLHIYQCHILPLLWSEDDRSKEVNFVPFAMVYQKNSSPPLNNECNMEMLNWARSVVERWRGSGSSYPELLNLVKDKENSQEGSTLGIRPTSIRVKSPKNVLVKKKKIVSRPSPSKRKRISEDDDIGCHKRNQLT